jgi:hypothetical protein
VLVVSPIEGRRFSIIGTRLGREMHRAGRADSGT